MPLHTTLEQNERAAQGTAQPITQLHVDDNPELKIPTGHLTPPNVTRHEQVLDKWEPEDWYRPPPPRKAPPPLDEIADLRLVTYAPLAWKLLSQGVSALGRLCPAWNAPVTCPHTGLRGAPLSVVIMRLNDRAAWSRERIADWLDSLDIDTHLAEPPEAREFTLGDLVREGAAVTKPLKRALTADNGQAACAQGAAHLAAKRRGFLDD